MPGKLRGLKPVREDGSVTYGGQTHPADGNAGLIVATSDLARAMSRDPAVTVRILGFGQSRHEKGFMPAAPLGAAQRALQAADVTMAQIDVVKSHNPFVINDIVFSRETGFPIERMNNFGCSLVWGHPQAPTGLRGTIEMIEELALRGGPRAVPGMCCGRYRNGACHSCGRRVMRTDMPTVVHMLDDASRRSPQLTALSDSANALTYAEYARCVAGLAAFLRERLAPGDVVLLVMGNSAEMAVAMLGTLAAGMQLCTANPNYTARELQQIEQDCAPRAVFTQRPYKQTVENAVGQRVRPIVIENAAMWMASWIEDQDLQLDLSCVDADALAILQYTGGTSGKPKGVELTHASLAANILQRDAVLPMREGDEHVLCVMPMFHAFASAIAGIHAAPATGWHCRAQRGGVLPDPLSQCAAVLLLLR